MASKEEDRKFILDWLEVYRDLPALWKVKSKQYGDRNKKNAAYDILLSKYQEKYPQATRKDVKKKITPFKPQRCFQLLSITKLLINVH